MKAAAGWYIDADDPSVDRYFNGSMWQRERRPHENGTTYMPGDGDVAEIAPVSDEQTWRSRMLAASEAQVAAAEKTAYRAGLIAFVVVFLFVLGVVVALVAQFQN